MYRLMTPAPALASYIENYWSVYPEQGKDAELEVEVFVDGRCDLLLNYGAPYQRKRFGEDAVVHTESNLDAQRTGPIAIKQSGQVKIVGVRFRLAGVSPFVDKDMAEFTDRTVGLEEVFGPEGLELEARVGEVGADVSAAKALLDQFFLRRLKPTFSWERFCNMMRVMEEGAISCQQLSERFSLSRRSVSRDFHRHLGLTPSFFARVVRFQGALARMMDGPKKGETLTELASELGYFDQAHFVKDFKAFAGGIPGRYRDYFPQCAPTDFAPNVVQFHQG